MLLQHGPMTGTIPGTIPHQQLYMQQQQQQPVHYATSATPSFHPYQQQFQLRQQYATAATHHPYSAPQQIMPMGTPAAAANTGMPPTMMPDSSALLGTAHLNYLANVSNVLQQPQQQQQQPHHAPMMPSASISTATKQSKAIKIVNPETMKEVDTSNLKKTSPASSARSTPKPVTESEQVQKFKQNVNKAAVDSKGSSEVTKQPAVTPNAIITHPNQEVQQTVSMVTTDPVKLASQDTVQSNEVVPPLPSNSGVHQKEPVNEAPPGEEKSEHLIETGSSSGSESSLQQQKQLKDNNSSSNGSSTEGIENVTIEQQPVDTATVIQKADEEMAEIREVVNKPEPVTMETLNAAELDKGSDSETPHMEHEAVREHNVGGQDDNDRVIHDVKDDIKHDVKHDMVQNVNIKEADTVVMEHGPSEDEASMEKPNVENANVEIPSMEKPTLGMEIPSSEECSMEESSMEEAIVDKSSMEQGDTILHKEAAIEDKPTEEEISAIEMESAEAGDSTGPSSLEGMERIQGVCVS